METIGKQISCPPDHQERIRTQAARDAQAVSSWLDDCCLASLPEDVRSRLSERTRQRSSGHGPPRQTIRRSFEMTAPADHWTAFETAAGSAGYLKPNGKPNLSEWICATALANLDSTDGLSERKPPHRPKKADQ